MSESNMPLISKIMEHARQTPDRVAIFDREKPISYAELLQSIGWAASYLSANNVASGDHVVIHATNSKNFITLYLATHYVGAVCVIVDPESDKDHLTFVHEAVKPKYIIDDVDTIDIGVETDEALSNDKPAPDDVADIMFTSGSTGEPKGVMLTHQQLSLAIEHINRHVGTKASHKELLLMPLCHSFGLGRARCVLYAGATLVLGYPLRRLKQVFRAMTEHGITGIGIVPSAWEFITSLTKDYISRYSSQIEYIELGSATLSAAQKQNLRRLFPNTNIVMHYGMTEVSRAVFSDFHKHPDECVGSIHSATSVKIVDQEGREVPQGTQGEILLKAPWMFSGYFRAPHLDGISFVGDYLRSGDIGSLTEDGLLYLHGRLKETINVGGKKVHPAAVEAVLHGHRSIADCACVAEPDPHYGEVVKAFIVLNDGHDLVESELRALAKRSLPSHQWPRVFETTAQIPRTAAGKLQRLKLVQRHSKV